MARPPGSPAPGSQAQVGRVPAPQRRSGRAGLSAGAGRRRRPPCAVRGAELAQGGVSALLTFDLQEKQGDADRDSGKAPPLPAVAPVCAEKTNLSAEFQTPAQDSRKGPRAEKTGDLEG